MSELGPDFPLMQDELPGARPAQELLMMVLTIDDEPTIGVGLKPAASFGATPLVKLLTVEEAIEVLNSLGGCIRGALALRDAT